MQTSVLIISEMDGVIQTEVRSEERGTITETLAYMAGDLVLSLGSDDFEAVIGRIRWAQHHAIKQCNSKLREY